LRNVRSTIGGLLTGRRGAGTCPTPNRVVSPASGQHAPAVQSIIGNRVPDAPMSQPIPA